VSSLRFDATRFHQGQFEKILSQKMDVKSSQN
jgi:hypothetical protein